MEIYKPPGGSRYYERIFFHPNGFNSLGGREKEREREREREGDRRKAARRELIKPVDAN